MTLGPRPIWWALATWLSLSGILSASTGSAPVDMPADSAVRTALETAALSLELGQPGEALAALNTVERIEPNNPWLWFYRGSAHLRQGNPYRAMECYDRAADILADLGHPDPALAETIRRYRHRARREVFNISLSTGLAYDTNVSYVGSGGETLGLISGRSDGKFASSARIDYAPIADETQTLALGTRLAHSWHCSVEQFNYQDYGTYLRYARRFGDHWEITLRYDYDMMLLGNDSFLSNHALTPGLTYYWPKGDGWFQLNRTEVYYQWQAQDFLFETTRAYDRDGYVNSVAAEQWFKCRPVPDWVWFWDVMIGYRFDYDATQGREFDYVTHDFYTGLEMPLINPLEPSRYLILPDKELTFAFSAHWEIDDYRNPSLTDRDHSKRADHITTFTFCVAQVLMDDPDFGKLVLRGIIDWMDAESNVVARRTFAKPFTYDKVVYGLQLEWSW